MSTLPNKWAVEITSLQDAEWLQKLFPDVLCNYDTLTKAFEKGIRLFEMDLKLSTKWFWIYSDLNSLHSTTMTSITELENLLK